MVDDEKKPTLTAPFANVKKNPKGFSYVEVAEVINRLNLVLGYGNWSFTVPESFRDGEWIIAKGRLEAEGGVYEQYGGVEISRYNEKHKRAGDIVDLSYEYKGAASEALKKCAQSLGVALYLALKRSPVPYESVLAETDSGTASDLTDSPGARHSSSGNDSSDDPHPPSGPPVVPAGVSPPQERGEDAGERGSSPASDPLDRFTMDAVNKRVNALSLEDRAEFMAAKRQFNPERFVEEATAWLDDAEKQPA